MELSEEVMEMFLSLAKDFPKPKGEILLFKDANGVHEARTYQGPLSYVAFCGLDGDHWTYEQFKRL